jgi:hypothetical protein
MAPRSTDWLVVVVALALAGACDAPSGPSADKVDPSNPREYLPVIDSANRQLAAGDARSAIEELIHAAELAELDSDGCPFAELTGDMADRMLALEHPLEARMAYAIAVRYARDCPAIDGTELRLRQDDAASDMRTASYLP